jgi:hypothetical protein
VKTLGEIEKAIAYFEDAVNESDEIIADCTEALQAELTEQKKHFVVALEVLRRAESENNLVDGMCCDCQHGTSKTCMDYSENDHCTHKKEDGSCWTPMRSENKPLSLEELRQMDGEPVWMVDGQGHEMYGIVNDTGCADADYGSWDADFYGMAGDGKHGLHIMGWLAYAHKPEQEKK